MISDTLSMVANSQPIQEIVVVVQAFMILFGWIMHRCFPKKECN